MTLKKAVGIEGERLAETYLTREGFAILERNYRKRCGEIDLIVEKDGILVFVEVKRSRFQGESHPELRVGYQKKLRLARTALRYLAENQPATEECRFDIITIKEQRGRVTVEHLENAFVPPEGWDD
jgi:putative endonuclease